MPRPQPPCFRQPSKMPGSFLTSDLVTLFASSEFGEAKDSVTLAGVVIPDGIFDDEDIDVTMGEGAAQIVPQPIFTCATAHVLGIADGQIMVIRGASFKVQNWKNDGTGLTEIYLERV